MLPDSSQSSKNTNNKALQHFELLHSLHAISRGRVLHMKAKRRSSPNEPISSIVGHWSNGTAISVVAPARTSKLVRFHANSLPP